MFQSNFSRERSQQPLSAVQLTNLALSLPRVEQASQNPMVLMSDDLDPFPRRIE